MNSHDFLIIMLILIIVVSQVLVFLSLSRRIKLFKEIFPDAHSFKTIKVRVPLDRIADITPEEILDNLSTYSSSKVHEEGQSSTAHMMEKVGPGYDEDVSEEALPQQVNLNENKRSEVWMRKGSKEEKVPLHSVRDYVKKGWKIILPNGE